MLLIVIRFVRTAYPVLKESILGKQSLLEAWKSSKFKVALLMYCLLSPVAMYYLTSKTVSLAAVTVKTNIAHKALVSQEEKCRVELLTAKTALIATPVPSVQPETIKLSAVPAPKRKRKIITRPATTAPLHSTNDIYNSILKHDHENY